MLTVTREHSVPIGNPGQVAYVAGNAFLDALSSFRNRTLLPVGQRTASLQLGAWESSLTAGAPENDEGAFVRVIRHADGMPLLRRAVAGGCAPVTVIASLRHTAFAMSLMYARDPYFASVIRKAKAASKKTSQIVDLDEHAVEVELLTMVKECLAMNAGDYIGELDSSPQT